MADGRRRVLWHGTMLVLLGLAGGAFLQSFANPRLALAAHVGGIMNGTLVMVVGAAWSELTLSGGLGRGLFWALLYSGYVNWLGLVLAAAFGTTLTTGAVVTLAAVVVVLLGLRRRPA